MGPVMRSSSAHLEVEGPAKISRVKDSAHLFPTGDRGPGVVTCNMRRSNSGTGMLPSGGEVGQEFVGYVSPREEGSVRDGHSQANSTLMVHGCGSVEGTVFSLSALANSTGSSKDKTQVFAHPVSGKLKTLRRYRS